MINKSTEEIHQPSAMRQSQKRHLHYRWAPSKTHDLSFYSIRVRSTIFAALAATSLPNIFNSCKKIAEIERQNVHSQFQRLRFVAVHAMKWSLLNVSFMFHSLNLYFLRAHTQTHSDVESNVQCIHAKGTCSSRKWMKNTTEWRFRAKLK